MIIMYQRVLKIGEEVHPLYVGKEKSLVPYLTKPLIVSVIQNPIFLSDSVAKEEVRFLQHNATRIAHWS